jgi:hypothetical protein
MKSAPFESRGGARLDADSPSEEGLFSERHQAHIMETGERARGRADIAAAMGAMRLRGLGRCGLRAVIAGVLGGRGRRKAISDRGRGRRTRQSENDHRCQRVPNGLHESSLAEGSRKIPFGQLPIYGRA